MNNLVMIIQDRPYHNNKAWDSLRIAGAALASDTRVSVYLLDEGVLLGTREQQAPEGHEDLQALLAELIECGMEVMMCGKSMGDHHVDDNDMIDGIERGSMKALAEWLKTADQTISL